MDNRSKYNYKKTRYNDFICPSTHGGAGFALGTYVNNKEEVICGLCGQVIGTKKDNNYPSKKLPEWIPDRSQIVSIEESIRNMKNKARCFNCKRVINLNKDTYLFSRPNIFKKRYRCKVCGKHHTKFLKMEFRERWINE